MVNADTFADIPIDQIETMLNWVSEKELEKYESIGKLTALNAAYTSQSNIDNVSSYLRSLNPYENMRFVTEARKLIDPETAKVFELVIDKDKVPEWVWSHISKDEIQAVAQSS